MERNFARSPLGISDNDKIQYGGNAVLLGIRCRSSDPDRSRGTKCQVLIHNGRIKSRGYEHKPGITATTTSTSTFTFSASDVAFASSAANQVLSPSIFLARTKLSSFTLWSRRSTEDSWARVVSFSEGRRSEVPDLLFSLNKEEFEGISLLREPFEIGLTPFQLSSGFGKYFPMERHSL
uniref:Uncharacterized protein LOC104242984 n=1 Tax=Nicotiana sylvestris TaxID=4096 RepID=A0A1U7YAW3_NICSY|nr:PREDICTED: uncharacterized protein LOC104242984 [Nicotiana sylvestris]